MQTQEIIRPVTFSAEEVLRDYRIGWESRHASLLGRKEVFMGKAKFGIFGDGKEVPQLAMARVFRPGDFRSGYYRDQTFMFGIGALTIEQFFAQLYAHADVEADPSSAGRCMNAHFSTRSLHPDGTWKSLTNQKNSSADISPTAAQMPRLVGLAWASKLYRQQPALAGMTDFSIQGNEVAFGTIGNASAAEGHFFESLNAAGVLQVPMIVSVWDDEYGISVHNRYQMTKQSVSEILAGLQRREGEEGFEVFKVKGWDYEALCQTYEQAAHISRTEHVPVLIHVVELTQPQGHSTSGSHERYKSKERLAWEENHDCLAKMRAWIIARGFADADTLDRIEKEAADTAKKGRSAAWQAFTDSMKPAHYSAIELLEASARQTGLAEIAAIHEELVKTLNPVRADALRLVRKALRRLAKSPEAHKRPLAQWLHAQLAENEERFSSHLYSQSAENALRISAVPAVYQPDSPLLDGREVMQAAFDAIFARDPRVVAFGEDVGRIGDVNQGFAGLQEKYGEIRISDTGIREATIIGQAIGAAMRGLRPIAEIQYLDYIYYAVQLLADDVSCLQYRTKGGQKAPLIIRTRGHRLEGIWHSGSPIGMLLHSLRGMLLLTPRNMTQAAGFYNTVLASDEPALIIECLNGYRLKEQLPANIGQYRVPVGIPEILRPGTDVTILTYGSMCRIVMEAAAELSAMGIEAEVIDAQSLLPFDVHQLTLQSVRKTNRIIFADEDVSGGATGYLMQQVLDRQGAYRYLDSAPVCISAKDHRPAYASDGDYFSKPNVDDVIERVYALMAEVDPGRFPDLYPAS